VSRRLAIGVWIVSMAMIAIGLTLIGLVPAGRAPAGATLGDALPILPLPLSAATVGAVIGWQRPGNRIGRLLSLLGLTPSLQVLAAGYAAFGLFSEHSLPQANVAAWLFSWTGAAVGLFAYLLLFEFPDGPLALRRTRIGMAGGVTGTVVLWLALAIVPGTLFNMSGVQNPFGLAGQEALVIALVGAAAILSPATVVLGVSSLRERYRRAEQRERLQLKWFLAGTIFATAGAGMSLPLVAIDFGLAKVGMSLAVSAIPIAIAIAILREHLYDIDVLINRALVYGATTAAIGMAFFAGIVILQAILRPLTSGSELAVAASTLACFALFQPLRRRIQGGVDRRFYRSRYDAARTLDAFSVHLRDEVALDAVRAELLEAVRETVQPTHASVWLREAGR
jgi:hypothetical protein